MVGFKARGFWCCTHSLTENTTFNIISTNQIATIKVKGLWHINVSCPFLYMRAGDNYISAQCPSLMKAARSEHNSTLWATWRLNRKPHFLMMLCNIYPKRHSGLFPTCKWSYTGWEWYLIIYCIIITTTCKWKWECHELWWEISTRLLWQKGIAQCSALAFQRVEINLFCLHV